ncbi:MAG TPA: hypothetical protein VMT57_00890 [Candidatus Thermoplasmatota archaeon]|nr:hypothetical protein [Candidatus Thermoplasmatota archaeon]
MISSKNTPRVILISIAVLLVMTLPSGSSVFTLKTLPSTGGVKGDLDPLVDLNITFHILYIRGLDSTYQQTPPDFFLKIWVNGDGFTSPIWNNTLRVYYPWNLTFNIPDDTDNVSILIELWNNQNGSPVLCDLSGKPNVGDQGKSLALIYHVKTGHWDGDDYLSDPSGYGRANGCDDGSIYANEQDCELGFTITFNDYDHDGIPYWTEVNVYGTDPTVDDRGEDANHDGIPIEWEFWWGYNPFVNDNHSALDPDHDSISNLEEYYTWSLFSSDPFRRDLFLEMDYMAASPSGEQSIVPADSREQLRDPFARRNIVFHFDTGEINGGEIIPYEPLVAPSEVRTLYNNYFLHNDSTAWRRGVFHWGLYVYATKPNGYGFSGDVDPMMGYNPGTNAFIISSNMMEKHARWKLRPLSYYYASATMHEMGHNMGLRSGHPPGCDDHFGAYPWQPGYWIYRTYKSIMNYRYTYHIFDYSDGSHGDRDFDDWSNLNLSYFEIPGTSR